MERDDDLFDLADEEERRHLRENLWALAMAQQAGTPPEALAILEREMGVQHANL